MGYQFIHLEGYARRGSRQKATTAKDGKPGRAEVRKWSAREIAAEAMREPGSCGHVERPQPPVVLFGCSPVEAAAMAEQWASTAVDGRGHALRADGLAMAAGVASLPAEQAEDWPRFREATVAWLREQYGERLRSVVEHTDEAHPHLHFYAVPLPGERFEVLHPGRLAASKKAQQGGKKGAQNAEYKKAMVGWQDGFQNAVAAHFGLVRLGPGRRRLTRGAWKAEQAQARALANPQPVEQQITGEDVKKRVTKKGILSDSYETGEELAARLTELVRKQGEPLAAKARRSSFDSDQVARLQKQQQETAQQLQKSEEQLQKSEEQLKELKQVLKEFQSVYTLDEMRARREEKRRKAERLEAQRRKEKEEAQEYEKLLLLAAENMTSANPLLSLDEAKQRVSQLERDENVDELAKWVKWKAPKADQEPENDQDEPGLGL